jgi:hypothetical protein
MGAAAFFVTGWQVYEEYSYTCNTYALLFSGRLDIPAGGDPAEDPGCRSYQSC